MTNEQTIIFIENQIRLLEKAFNESDGMMVGVDRHEEWEHIGDNKFSFMSIITSEEHRARNPLEWSEEVGSAKALDPIKNEIDSMKELVKTLKGE